MTKVSFEAFGWRFCGNGAGMEGGTLFHPECFLPAPITETLQGDAPLMGGGVNLERSCCDQITQSVNNQVMTMTRVTCRHRSMTFVRHDLESKHHCVQVEI